ncbi:hypothetical protein [Moraxella bovis]|uniref:hypothetical protein n=1 Tax=Moraxella bovis TaxID=476 RepID=UPI000991958D|nr:hypothetical protein [Moraxella bovis]
MFNIALDNRVKEINIISLLIADMMPKKIDKATQQAYDMTQGVSKPPILHSVIATPSDFLLPITFCYGQDGAYRENAQPTVYGVLNILSTLFQTRVKSQYTGVLANV